MATTTSPDQQREIIFTFRGGKVGLVTSVLEHIEEWCEANGYDEPHIGNAEDGSYEVAAIRQEEE